MKRRAGMHAPRAFIHSSIRSHTVGSPIPYVITSSYHHITSSHKRVCVQSLLFSHLLSHLATCACSRPLRAGSRLHLKARHASRGRWYLLFSAPRPPSHTHHLAYHIIPTYPCRGPAYRRLGVTASPHLGPRGPWSSFVN